MVQCPYQHGLLQEVDGNGRGHNSAVLDHVGDHLAVGRARLDLRAQQVSSTEVDEAKLLWNPTREINNHAKKRK